MRILSSAAAICSSCSDVITIELGDCLIIAKIRKAAITAIAATTAAVMIMLLEANVALVAVLKGDIYISLIIIHLLISNKGIGVVGVISGGGVAVILWLLVGSAIYVATVLA
jgi:hypothetical protein